METTIQILLYCVLFALIGTLVFAMIVKHSEQYMKDEENEINKFINDNNNE